VRPSRSPSTGATRFQVTASLLSSICDERWTIAVGEAPAGKGDGLPECAIGGEAVAAVATCPRCGTGLCPDHLAEVRWCSDDD
jgi:hypothetical protein